MAAQEILATAASQVQFKAEGKTSVETLPQFGGVRVRESERRRVGLHGNPVLSGSSRIGRRIDSWQLPKR